jgi:GH15 family glucan-1,4-alpha-glucosidase
MSKIPPISDYGYIGDCHSAALISNRGSIDWCCIPRIDSPSCFGRLLDEKKGGHFQIAPVGKFESQQNYRGNTMILETHFTTKTGKACLIDFFPMRTGGKHTPYQQIIRIVEGSEGVVKFRAAIEPRFEYGAINSWIRNYKRTSFIAMGGSNGLLLSSSMLLKLKGPHHLDALFSVRKGQRLYFSILYRRPEELDECLVEVPSNDELDWRLSQTEHWWHNWFAQGKITGPHADLISRSALVLKALSNAPTGAVAAAVTTSLPEKLGGMRNWDYRYTWIRDSYFSVRCLARLGFIKESTGFSRFILRTSHSSAEGLQTLYGVAGETRLAEYTLDDLSGYYQSKPVRIGNAAVNQLQFDIYGDLLDLAWHWFERGYTPGPDYWKFLTEIVNFVCDCWQKVDSGIWEMRDTPRHFVLSKAMCWVALDRGIKLAEKLDHVDDLDKWKEIRELIRQTVEEKGYNAERGIFTQAFGVDYVDASLLLLPMFGFLDYQDERMVRTTEAIWQDLQQDGLLLRYPLNTDGLPGEEGVFIPCSFLLVVCLARQGKVEEALKLFQRTIKTCNCLGLFSEEYDTKNNMMLGNFPQGLTHLSLITAAIALEEKSAW